MIIECGIYKGQRMYLDVDNDIRCILSESGLQGIYNDVWFCGSYLRAKFEKAVIALAADETEIV